MSPRSESGPSSAPSGGAEPAYSPEERAFLLEVAHRAIRQSLARAAASPASSLASPWPRLLEPRGAFTTLHLAGSLRGCVGYILGVKPLVETVAETAVAAAFNDPRFPPVTAEEEPLLRIELSVLSPPQPIGAEAIVPGRHGLIVSAGKRRGLLLPQVAGEYGWDAQTFLAHTCRKAGLPDDAWLRGATVEAFTAEVFGEE